MNTLVRIAVGIAVAGVALFAGEVPSVTTLDSRIERVVVVRLKNGTDMLEGLKEAVAREKVKSAVVLNGFGSLTSYHVHVVGNSTLPAVDLFQKESAPYDLIAVSGAVIDGRVHAHITLASPGKSLGGHLEPGSRVMTFVFVTLGVLDDKADLRRFDDQTWR